MNLLVFLTEPREVGPTGEASPAGARPSGSCTDSPLLPVSPAINPRPGAARAELHTAGTREQLGICVRVHEVCNINKPRWDDLLQEGTAQLPTLVALWLGESLCTVKGYDGSCRTGAQGYLKP